MLQVKEMPGRTEANEIQQVNMPSEIINYRPVNPMPGDIVILYPDGDRRQTPGFGIVYSLQGRVIDVMIMNPRTQRAETCREVHFIEDPKFTYEPQIRKDGGWDWHPMYKRIIELEKRLSVLESQQAPFGSRPTVAVDPRKWLKDRLAESSARLKTLSEESGYTEDKLEKLLTEENGFVVKGAGWYANAE